MTATPTEVQTTVRAEGEVSHEERFRWRAWVHHPDGVVTCPNATNGKCREEDHFHAICRLPNPWQHDDIVEKAQAARARRVRLLRDEESDARVILEDQLDLLKEVPNDLIADELVESDFAEDYQAAIREVLDTPDPDFVPEDDETVPTLYANINQDREEYLRQRDLPDDQRSEDFTILEKTFSDYAIDVKAALERIQKPKVAHLTSLDKGELIAMVRRQRMEQAATQAYLNAYTMWQMYLGTLKPVEKGSPGQRVWDSIQEMRENVARDIIVVVRRAFDHLDAQLARGEVGKGD